MKITIISAYTWFNKGDAAILLGTLKELEEYYSDFDEDVEFNILSFTPDVDRKKYKDISPNVNIVTSNLFNPYPVKKDKKNKLKAIFKMGLQFINMFILQLFSFKKLISRYEGLKICANSDLVIVCGGGFLGGNKYNSLMHIAQLFFVNKLEVPKILWGTSIEPPTKKILKNITEGQLKKLDYILPREKVTLNYLASWYPENKTVFTPDMAFKTPYQQTEKSMEIINKIKLEAKGKTTIGITMREWNFPKSLDSKADKENYESSLVQLIDKYSADSVFVFIPQVIMSGDDDRIFANHIKNKLSSKDSLIVLEEDFSPYELKWMISQFDQFLGTRMHSNIFSSTMKLPPVAIAYESKTNGIMHNLDLDDYVIDIEGVSVSKLDNLLILNKKNKKELSDKLDNKINNLIFDIRFATKKVLGDK